jgi:hypothetical protein
MAIRENSDSRVRYGRVLGLICVVAGFAAIGLGWNGAAGQGCVDCQFPYVISGGLAGLALVVFGTGLLVVSALRAERMHLQDALERGAGAAQAAETAQLASGRTGGSSNGSVVIGKTTYHRPDCRLVAGKDDLERASLAQAEASGLSACRVCNPARSDASTAAR